MYHIYKSAFLGDIQNFNCEPDLYLLIKPTLDLCLGIGIKMNNDFAFSLPSYINPTCSEFEGPSYIDDAYLNIGIIKNSDSYKLNLNSSKEIIEKLLVQDTNFKLSCRINYICLINGWIDLFRYNYIDNDCYFYNKINKVIDWVLPDKKLYKSSPTVYKEYYITYPQTNDSPLDEDYFKLIPNEENKFELFDRYRDLYDDDMMFDIDCFPISSFFYVQSIERVILNDFLTKSLAI